MKLNADWSSSAVAVALVFTVCAVAVGPVAADATTAGGNSTSNETAEAGTTTESPPAGTDETGNESNRTATPSETESSTETETSTEGEPTNSTSTETQTETRTRTQTETPEPTGDVSVSNLSASDAVRAGDDVEVTARATNRGSTNATETLGYWFGGERIASQSITLAPGESESVRFGVSFADVEAVLGPVESGTYVHGVRNESGAGAAARVRVTPDVDLAVETVNAPTEVSHGESYIVLATVRNPAETTVTRQVAYEFAGRSVVERAVTVAGTDDRRVAFEVSLSDVESVAGPVHNETTYDHGVVTGDARRGGSVRVVRSPSADASALAVESFETVDDVRPDDRYRLNLSVRNVDTADFEGQLSYRVDGAVVATEWTRVPIGERRTVSFDVRYDDVADAAVPLSAADTEHGVFVGDDAVATRPVTVHVPAEPETTARPTPTFTESPALERSAPTAEADVGDTTDAVGECRRGFFTACGGTAMGETSLTLVGILLSGFGIAFQMFQGSR